MKFTLTDANYRRGKMLTRQFDSKAESGQLSSLCRTDGFWLHLLRTQLNCTHAFAITMSNLSVLVKEAAGAAHKSESVTLSAFITSLSSSILVLVIAVVVFWCLKDRDTLT